MYNMHLLLSYLDLQFGMLLRWLKNHSVQVVTEAAQKVVDVLLIKNNIKGLSFT